MQSVENSFAPEQSPLPSYADDYLATLRVNDLIVELIANEDRVPRNLIDECARRGDAMAERLSEMMSWDHYWQNGIELGEWWFKLHAVMILGLIPTERAARALVALMRRMSVEEDDNLQDWFAGRWPILFLNKPADVVADLVALAEDRTLDWYIRANANEPVLALAHREGADALEARLDWLARIAADETEEWTVRLMAGGDLLDFPRPRFRALLDDLVARQKSEEVHFDSHDMERAFGGMRDEPNWLHFDNPWKFYEPDTIVARQTRWEEEDRKARERLARGDATDAAFENEFDGDDDVVELPYIRATPKIGRNDPCPCGSGKKYKKCCLAGSAG